MRNFHSLFALGFILLATVSCSIGNKFAYKKIDHSSNSNLPEWKNSKSAESDESMTDEMLLNDLLAIENDWKRAKFSGDTITLNRIFADEFTNTIQDGTTFTKMEWIDYLKGGNANVENFEITEAKLLVRTKDSATISFKITTFYKPKDYAPEMLNDVDKFVFRDGRWQVISSVSVEENQDRIR